MEATGVPVSRWFDLVLESKENIEQPDNLRAMVFWGHAANSQTRLPDMKKAMEKLDLLVIIDPYTTMAAVMSARQNGTYLLPAATQLETVGSLTSSKIGRASCREECVSKCRSRGSALHYKKKTKL